MLTRLACGVQGGPDGRGVSRQSSQGGLLLPDDHAETPAASYSGTAGRKHTHSVSGDQMATAASTSTIPDCPPSLSSLAHTVRPSAARPPVY